MPLIRVASYCRISTDHEDQANSFASQKRYFQEYIERHPDWQLHAVYADEGITGTSTKRRAQFMQMIEDALDGAFKLILTKEISRFSRNILDTIAYTRMLKRAGVGVLFMTENLNTLDPEAEMLLTFMGTIAQEESRRTSVRVKWGQTRRMEQGIVFGPSPLGYHVRAGKIEVEAKGAELVRRIFHKYGIEQKGTSVICRELQQEGYRTPTGNRVWCPGQIVKILKNEKYVGDLIQKKSITPDYLSHAKRKNRGEEALVILENHHEAIVDRALWDTVQQELSRRNKHRESGAGNSTRYPLSGKIKCGECGSGFVSRYKTGGDGSKLRRWGCRKAAAEGRKRNDSQNSEGGCDVGWLLREEAACSAIKCALARLELDREGIVNQIVSAAVSAQRIDRAGRMARQKPILQELERLEEKKLLLIDARLSGEISAEEGVKLRLQYEERAKQLQEQLAQHKLRGETEHKYVENIRSASKALLSGESESDIFFKTLVQDMTVYRTRNIKLRFFCLPQVFIFHETD